MYADILTYSYARCTPLYLRQLCSAKRAIVAFMQSTAGTTAREGLAAGLANKAIHLHNIYVYIHTHTFICVCTCLYL